MPTPLQRKIPAGVNESANPKEAVQGPAVRLSTARRTIDPR